MGKHKGKPDSQEPSVPGTDTGIPFDTMTGEQKAGEFDSSLNDPTGYAARNFRQDNANGGAYEAQRAEQREQQKRNR